MKRTRNNYKAMAKEDPKMVGTLEGFKTLAKVELKGNIFAGEDPVVAFYQNIADALDMKIEDIRVDKIAVSKDTAELFNPALIDHMRKKNVRAHRFEYNFRMLHLQYAPRIVSDVDDLVAHLVERVDD
jgi:hypothetical protein